MPGPQLSAKFLLFLEDYARRIGKAPERIIEEAVSQAILRHESDPSVSRNALLMPQADQARLTRLLPGFDGLPTDTTLGEFLERLPDQNWTYQAARLDDWWFLLVTKAPLELPEPLELRSVETSQAYVWLFGHAKVVRLWSALDHFLIVF